MVPVLIVTEYKLDTELGEWTEIMVRVVGSTVWSYVEDHHFAKREDAHAYARSQGWIAAREYSNPG